MRRGAIATLALAVSLAAVLLSGAAASATTISTHNFISSFDGTGSKSATESTGPFAAPEYIGIDQKTNNVYVSDGGFGGVVSKFDSNGNPSAFSGLGPGVNSVHAGNIGGLANVSVDNSPGASHGQIWVFQEGQQLHALNPSGVEIGGPNFPIEPFGDMCGGATDPQGNFWWSPYNAGLYGFAPGGESLAKNVLTGFGNCAVAIDQSQPGVSETSGYFYISEWASPNIHAYDKNGVEKYVLNAPGAQSIAVDPYTGDIYVTEGDHVTEYEASTTSTPGPQISEFGRSDGAHGFPAGLCGSSHGIDVNETTHRVYVQDCGKVDVFGPGVEYIVPTVVTDPAEVEPTGAVLKGHVDPDNGGDTTSCKFEWGFDTSYGENVPCAPVGPIHNVDGNTAVSAHISGLTAGTTYHYRIVAANANGQNTGADVEFKPQGKPQFSKEFVSEVNTDGARLTGTIDPVGSTAEYHFEYGPDTNYGSRVPATDRVTASGTQKETFTTTISGLSPNTTYHFRIVGKNESGTSFGNDVEFKTFDTYPGTPDDCPNALVRKQTGAALLLDCRAYEIASAGYSGGYNVESDLIPGQAPPVARPSAPGRLLYSLHYGAIPNLAGNPPNLGLDPYVSERTPDSWVTRYVGIAADAAPSVNAYGSPLLASDRDLTAFAFGGANLCAPCFTDGSTGIPVRLGGGSLVQGLAGSENPASPEPSGYIAKPLSADGTHLVFGSTSKLTGDGGNNELTIYDRDLAAGTTHAVSKKPDGSGTMSGAGLGELDISADGSRILIGEKISADVAGNTYWHLYMNIGDAAKTVDLTPGATAGALYAGMSPDGSRVFFTTPDKLTGDGDNTSADLYAADVAANGTVTTQLLSSGSGAGNTDACNPIAGKKLAHWNSVTGAANCGVVAFSGGMGVASSNGTVYFLSPEQLDGQGTLNAPNLFVVKPGQATRFVATLQTDDPGVKDAVENNELQSYRDIQVTPDGEDAVFSSVLPLTGYANLGHSEIYRYDYGDDQLVCVSCAPTGATPSTEATLSGTGLNLADDGRVFFTTAEQLALRDTNKQRDAYEWEDGVIELISSGSSGTGSGLVSVSADGTDAFFFTRQVLSVQDANGTAMKIYDARSEGGFFADIQAPPCQASDECHGPGTQAAPPPQIGTLEGSVGNYTGGTACRKGFVKRHGKCVKKRHSRHRRKRHQGRSHG